MTNSASRRVSTSQTVPHTRLREIVEKHLREPNIKPIAAHGLNAIEKILHWIGGRGAPLILDACCGVGDSSRVLAKAFPNHLVIGVDKSVHRLTRSREQLDPDNMMLMRADLNDLYRLLVEAGVSIDRHYILYPNPWPKPGHLGRRWHGAPAFAHLVQLGRRLELRSNWRLYLEEFQIALEVGGRRSSIKQIVPSPPMTPFEAKYQASDQDLWQLVCEN